MSSQKYQKLTQPRQLEFSKLGYRFSLEWIIFTFLGYLISLLLIEIGERPHLGALQGAIGGAIIGTTQAFVLRQHLEQPWWWILANSLSWSLIGAVGIGVMGWFAPQTDKLFLRIVFGITDGMWVGTLVGVGQWFALSRELQGASFWILAHGMAWAVALPIAWTVGGILRLITDFFWGEVIGLALGWIIVAAVTSVALIQIINVSHH